MEKNSMEENDGVSLQGRHNARATWESLVLQCELFARGDSLNTVSAFHHAQPRSLTMALYLLSKPLLEDS
jgi:hypothetical protein